jgi:NAD(P)-dependent dehydrogenase (short-subunit alcohol dehydrogenase family)
MSEGPLVVLITGAGRGIGFATAQSFAAQGWAVAIAEIDPATCHAAAETLSAAGAQVSAHVVDVGNADEVAALVAATVERHGALHAVVNNAFTPVLDDPDAVSLEDWQRCVDVNLRAAWLCSVQAHPIMKRQGGGAIVNVISVHAWMTQPHFFPYNVAKGGLLALTKSLAVEYGRDDIHVNAVAPGWIESVRTPAFFDFFTDLAEAKRRVFSTIPLKRMGKPEEIGSAIHFLCSEGARYISGTTLVIDGGHSVLEVDLSDLKKPTDQLYWQATTFRRE